MKSKSYLVRRTVALSLRLRYFLMCGLLSIVCSAANSQVPVSAEITDGEWWKHAVIYEIYPRSFQDSNGDGTGDIKGIIRRLGYLQSLGIDAIWLTPIYPSPQVDFGYDIADYESIDPQYGTLADFDRLIAEAKRHHIRVLMDMVLNHTSDQHPWFLSSKASKNNPKRDWYIWRDGKNGGPPNNWQSCFGHSAWEYDATTKQWYYHMFYKQQPDLNWRNPDVQKAMFNAVRFWLDRGVAGFRLDAITMLFEDPDLHDGRMMPGINAFGDHYVDAAAYTDNLPEVHDVIRRLRTLVDSYPGNRILIGETYLPNIAELDKWYGGAAHDQLQLPMDLLIGTTNKLDAALLRQRIQDVETGVHGSQPLLVFDNHDLPRELDRYGDGQHNPEIARILATALLATRTTALMYYGQELGMVTSTPTRKEDVKDPIGIMGWPKEKGRDGERTPMQWDATQNAGFTSAKQTWLPIPQSFATINVSMEEADPGSLLHWYRKLIQLRRDISALRDGSMVMLDVSNPDVLSFERRDPNGRKDVFVAINFTDKPHSVSLQECSAKGAFAKAKTLLSYGSGAEANDDLCEIRLPSFGVWVGGTGW